jgi:hypothetical protein
VRGAVAVQLADGLVVLARGGDKGELVAEDKGDVESSTGEGEDEEVGGCHHGEDGKRGRKGEEKEWKEVGAFASSFDAASSFGLDEFLFFSLLPLFS